MRNIQAQRHAYIEKERQHGLWTTYVYRRQRWSSDLCKWLWSKWTLRTQSIWWCRIKLDAETDIHRIGFYALLARSRPTLMSTWFFCVCCCLIFPAFRCVFRSTAVPFCFCFFLLVCKNFQLLEFANCKWRLKWATITLLFWKFVLLSFFLVVRLFCLRVLNNCMSYGRA